ncbi:hypothetical protein BG61_29590 [Caballeronia glathei]|uniref:Uncharacterized protein n=2 Tax=Caballeronia glathei TaxID=60547 RepID=A0A069PHL6_9BURK|nr:hypothetical protein BG61_29590 [Caballeronia glathei]
MGMACHIFSAAKNGPRGRGGKDEEFISSERNGLWCCNYHGTLIDKAKGCDFSADTLFAWKALAEARTAKQMNDIPSPLGWVEEIAFTQFANTDFLPRIRLSRRTLLWGKSGTGKTILLEAAASISQAKYAERFSASYIVNDDGVRSPAPFGAKVTYSTVDSLSKEISLRILGIELTRQDGSIPCLLPPGDLEVIYCSELDCRRRDDEDDLDFMMRALHVDKSALLALAKKGTNTVMAGEITIRQGSETDDDTGDATLRYKENGDPYFELLFRKACQNFFVTYNRLSGSEKDRLILDLLIAKAREVCKQRLTLLLIECLAVSLDSNNLENLLGKLTEGQFQVIVTLPPRAEKDVLEVKSGRLKLREADYLKSWQLALL